jgi:hypothetical protein
MFCCDVGSGRRAGRLKSEWPRRAYRLASRSAPALCGHGAEVRAPKKMGIWIGAAGFLVVGYLSMTRSFAYLGIPPLKIFIGEIVLAAFLFLKPRVALGTWTASLLRQSPLNALGIALLVFILYGIWQMGRGVVGGSAIVYTLKLFIFNYYTLYLFFGIWIGLRAPEFLPKLVRAIAWVNGLYGLMFLVALDDVQAVVPGSDVQLFGKPVGSAAAILGLLCFEHNLRRVWPLLALNITVALIMQWRTEWLGLGLGILAWGFLTGRFGRVVAMGMTALIVLGMIELADIRVVGRSSTVSLGETVARVIAPIDVELAKQLSPHAERHAHTMEWREKWWAEIWRSVHSTPMLEAFGHGYGFDLFALAPEDVREGQVEEIRTPHSVFYFALGYTGWVGVILFVVLQFAILKLLWRSYQLTRQPVGVVWWVMGIAMANFEAGFDTPYRAIPFYLLWGMALAPGLAGERSTSTHRANAGGLSPALDRVNRAGELP